MSEQPENRSLAAIRNVLDAGRALIYLQTSEEERAVELFRALPLPGSDQPPEVYVWSLTDGLQIGGRACKTQPQGPRGVLDFILSHRGRAVFLLRDFHECMRDSAEIRRRLRDLVQAGRESGKVTVICSPVRLLPPELERDIAFIKLPLPDAGELAALVRAMVGADDPGPDDVQRLARALQGLTLQEAGHAVRFALSRAGRLDASAIPLLQEEKRLLVRRTGLIEYVPDAAGIDELGGLETLKNWLRQRRDLFYARDGLAREIVPKGVLLMGVSGCGKSLSARVIASVFGLPLYRVNMSQIFAAGLGEAERLFAEACRTMEEVAPAVVWFDEIEDALSRQHQDAAGVLDRIFGFFLTWMQEKPPGLFIAATANRIDLLPAEMLRKGRFDQVFFIDLPDPHERLEIFGIHLRRRGVDVSGLNLNMMASRSEGWTGAEIEQCVVSAITAARIENRPVGDDHFFAALREIVPLSRTMKEQVGYIRAWAFDRALRASPKT